MNNNNRVNCVLCTHNCKPTFVHIYSVCVYMYMYIYTHYIHIYTHTHTRGLFRAIQPCNMKNRHLLKKIQETLYIGQ